jgi:hypothetical protein
VPVRTISPEYLEEWILHERYDWHTAIDALGESEVDFDDEADDDQLPLEVVEAIEAGVGLDDAETVSDEA